MGHTAWLTPEETKQSEDCLVLNVWRPEPVGDAKLPVMVYVHGGGFAYGSASADGLDGANLARRGVVVVTVNHRLNVFGHLYLDDVLGDQYAGSANVALLDLVAALEWVRDNIGVFGGDPSNVTIFGQSGGGSKVTALLAMPGATGLAHRAVVQSASSALRFATIEEASRNTHHLLRQLDIDAGTLKDVPAEMLLGAMRAAIRAAGGVDNYRPVVDDVVLIDQPLSPTAVQRSAHVDVITGWCDTEQRLRFSFETDVYRLGVAAVEQRVADFVGIERDQAHEVMQVYAGHSPADSPADLMALVYGDHRYRRTVTSIADARAAVSGSKTYLYRLTWRTPVLDGLLRTPHSLCLPFIFSNVDRAVGITGSADDRYEIQDQMSQAWAAFAAGGDPNHAGLRGWLPYATSSRHIMNFGRNELETDPAAATRVVLAACPPYEPALAEGGARR